MRVVRRVLYGLDPLASQLLVETESVKKLNLSTHPELPHFHAASASKQTSSRMKLLPSRNLEFLSAYRLEWSRRIPEQCQAQIREPILRVMCKVRSGLRKPLRNTKASIAVSVLR